ncbi:related to Conserved oligomeric Golgi complex subunit 6 [Saccharomycodes ludwigii]|uniref:Conserved oligomeric Golgi complex subunit 6 n=1 Tax=Saccharomycodes ludwigii TaxID=36035 RepID=A0A376B309_9ASCO|nr:hypothetical protein SCDLUD_002768 [Saccharomycodes ludwigii]KAH3901278.1 hypothetical protein SCDLUD_002768 [Saccharomycodes ludwigii]SSD59067.1 related to Conserved oligomeric Golgi complex subunit 6 [Saccharomycodes ludwigii]
MDFLYYQQYIIAQDTDSHNNNQNSSSNKNNNTNSNNSNVLPEPATRLSLTDVVPNKQFPGTGSNNSTASNNTPLNLNLLKNIINNDVASNTSLIANGNDLSYKMAKYAEISLNEFSNNNGQGLNNKDNVNDNSNIVTKNATNFVSSNYQRQQLQLPSVSSNIQDYIRKGNDDLASFDLETDTNIVSPNKKLSAIAVNSNSILSLADQLLATKLSNILADASTSSFSGNSVRNTGITASSTITNLRKCILILQTMIEDDAATCENTKDIINFKELLRTDFVGALKRKTLRSQLEREVLKENQYFLNMYIPIIKSLNRLSDPLMKILAIVKKDEKARDVFHKKITENIYGNNSEILTLRNDLKMLKLKKTILIYLKNNFTLNQLQDDILKNGDVNLEFFQVVDKILQIKENCAYLLSADENIGEAGTVLNSQLNDYLNIATKKIYNSLLDFLYEYDSREATNRSNTSYFPQSQKIDDDATISLFKKKLVYLSNDVEFFNSFLTKVIDTRSKKNLDDFLSQFELNMGTTVNTPVFTSKDKNSKVRPIILSAHDPIRYLGDVLAYVHSLLVNEQDFVDSLFKFQNESLEHVPKIILQETRTYLQGLDNKVLNGIFAKLANSIRIRLEQIIRFESDCTINLEIIQLLKLYQMMYTKYGISQNNLIIKNLKELKVVAQSKIIQDFADFIENNNVKPSENVANANLLPPEWLPKYLNKICDFFGKLESSLDSFSSEEEETRFTNKVLKEPFMEILPKQLLNSYPKSKKETTAKVSLLIMQVNCFDLIKSRIMPFHQTIFNGDNNVKMSEIYKALLQELDKYVNKLLEVQTRILFTSTGCEIYYNLFNMIFPIESVQEDVDYEMYYSVLENPIMNLDKIGHSVTKSLNDYLPKALTDFQDKLLFNLTSPIIADDISNKCFTKFSQFYSVFRNVLFLLYPNDKERIIQVLNFTPQEVDTLIGIA